MTQTDTHNGLNSKRSLLHPDNTIRSSIILGSQNMQQSQFSGQLPHQHAPVREWPTEVDLSEFMLDTDLDVFARHFDVNYQYP